MTTTPTKHLTRTPIHDPFSDEYPAPTRGGYEEAKDAAHGIYRIADEDCLTAEELERRAEIERDRVEAEFWDEYLEGAA